MSEHKTIVLVDKYGELWTLYIPGTPCVGYFFIGSAEFSSKYAGNSDVFIEEVAFIYERNSDAFIEGMGMEVLGEL